MAQSALIVAIVYFIFSVTDTYFISWGVFSRPIAIAPFVGLALGDFETGIIMGAALESVFMGVSAIGGAMPSDPMLASVISTAYVITSKGSIDMETALALAMPIGTVLMTLPRVFSPLMSLLPAYWEKLIATGNHKAFLWQSSLASGISPLINSVIVFIAVTFGVDGLNLFLTSIPAWLLNGITASGSMMMAVGFALLTSMIWDWSICYFFIFGFVLVKYLGLGTLPIAIIAATAAITIFLIEKNIIDAKSEFSGGASEEEEDFF